jgi:hypothetical protein
MKFLSIGIVVLLLGWGADTNFLFSAENEKSDFPIPKDNSKIHRFDLPSFKDALLGKIDLPSQDLRIPQDSMVSSEQVKIDFREALSVDLGLKSLKNDALGSQNSIVKNQMQAHRSNASVIQASVLKSLGVPISAKDVIRIQSLNATLDRINKGTLNVNSLSGNPDFNNLNSLNSQTLSNLSNIQLNGPINTGAPNVLLPPQGTQIELGNVGTIGSPALSLPEDPIASLPTQGVTENDPLAKLRQLQENLLKLQQAGQQIQQEAERRALELRIKLCSNIKPENYKKYPNLKCCELDD